MTGDVLTVKQQQAYDLHIRDRYSLQVTANTMGISRDACNKLIRKARRKRAAAGLSDRQPTTR